MTENESLEKGYFSSRKELSGYLTVAMEWQCLKGHQCSVSHGVLFTSVDLTSHSVSLYATEGCTSFQKFSYFIKLLNWAQVNFSDHFGIT